LPFLSFLGRTLALFPDYTKPNSGANFLGQLSSAQVFGNPAERLLTGTE
jgi:hypothetical protein